MSDCDAKAAASAASQVVSESLSLGPNANGERHNVANASLFNGSGHPSLRVTQNVANASLFNASGHPSLQVTQNGPGEGAATQQHQPQAQNGIGDAIQQAAADAYEQADVIYQQRES